MKMPHQRFSNPDQYPMPYVEPTSKIWIGLGVLEKINHSEWAAPKVPIPKADGSIRICGDCKVTFNPALQVDQFPMLCLKIYLPAWQEARSSQSLT